LRKEQNITGYILGQKAKGESEISKQIVDIVNQKVEDAIDKWQEVEALAKAPEAKAEGKVVNPITAMKRAFSDEAVRRINTLTDKKKPLTQQDLSQIEDYARKYNFDVAINYLQDQLDNWDLEPYEIRNNKRIIKYLQKIKTEITERQQPSKTEQVIEKLTKPKAKRIISEEAYKRAKKELTDFGTLQAGINPKQFVNLATIGAYHIENGLRSFGTWSKKMLEEFGESIKPHLKQIWRDSKKHIKLGDTQTRKNLIKHIHTIKTRKGLTDKQFKEIKRTITESGMAVSSGRMTVDELESLVKKMERARPRRIEGKRVITKKTEKAIQTLKTSLEKKYKMTDEAFQDILEREVNGKEPRYIDAKNFITQTEGGEIIKRMHDLSEILEVTQPYEEAVSKNEEVSKEVNSLKERISRKKVRDPWRTESMRYYVQQAQRVMKAPVYAMYRKLIELNDIMHRTHKAKMEHLKNTIEGFEDIAGDEEALNRVAEYIASQSRLKDKPAVPKDITDNEIKLAKEIQKIGKEYELKARVNKFFNWLDTEEGIAEYEDYKKEIHKARDIYDSQDKEALIEYLKTQTWGVIKSGYEPLETFIWKVRLYNTGPKTLGKGHIKIRTDIEYHKQERNILQRLSSYMRQMDMLYELGPKIKAFVRLFDDNMGQFKDSTKVQESIETFLRNLKRYNIEGGFWGDLFARVYAQVSQIIIMANPVLAYRNLFQNPAFEHDKTILFDPRNEPLTAEELEYFESHVSQFQGMVEEYFMVNEKAFWGTRWGMKILRKIKIYPWSDITNRGWSFRAKINQVKRAFSSGTLKEKMKRAKFDDITEEEQVTALEILAKDGMEAMAQYVAKVHVDDIHFLYERAQRSPSEMDILGRTMGNLMLFPRSYAEKMAHAMAALKNKNSTLAQRTRATKRIVAVIVGGYISGTVYMMTTGRRRNPYDPFQILQISPGGLVFGATEQLFEAGAYTIRALKGDESAMYALTSILPTLANNFIPFYDWSLRGLEAVTDSKNLDRKFLREIYSLIDKEYNVRDGEYEMKRDFMEKLQYVIAGPSVDKKIEEREKEAGF